MDMATSSVATMVSVAGLTKHFGSHQVLGDVDLSVAAGERVVVCGPSGSGKSTLARCISGLESYASGTVSVNGVVVSPRMRHADLVRANIGMVFQQFNLFPHLTVLENCTLAQRWVRRRSRQEARQTALAYLDKVRLAEKASAYPAQLSGGQQQRVAIARALCLNPSVMLFDEATSALDPEMVKEVLETMILLARDGMTMICITHEMGFARAVADKVAFMDGGRIVQAAPPGEFFGNCADPRIQRFLSKVF
ncbi:polar amino acid transport system ATP-binding protein/general L-amino acid transport system ATP-binding protein [Variovorax paradoxus]|uniref:Polar amino acid transport system ATP-binding protein/general L-amino acid transport system ATP-binding protein n=2 Tax=Variovorax paradoxus TaxID=34073 RepID=A0AAE3Y1E3_VARPD|nr:polar amino acid transport system ATP-binding protein/general L-amino acid transport system ATP-binding protein [Variovorax paradoxus]MDR6428814.1 polar amino acid transport system ATP-binding protein/general L-amino acid transport system ATP-binding protein [Variovorax paradoxus]MDR6455860.1 polar amino acid transport system ATP-binding protein/general L-amino acid transport system ATP-binding protein [Variovorax paradoxus]